MKVVLDIDVVLDALIDKRPGGEAARKLLLAAASGRITGVVCAHQIAIIYLVVKKAMGASTAQKAIVNMLRLLSISKVDSTACKNAAALPVAEFDKALVLICAQHETADYIAAKAAELLEAKVSIKTMTPEAIIQALASSSS